MKLGGINLFLHFQITITKPLLWAIGNWLLQESIVGPISERSAASDNGCL